MEHAGITRSVRCFWTLGSSAKQEKKGSAEAHPLPLRCLSQLFPVKENINYLGN